MASWRTRVPLATGGWYDEKHSETVAKSLGFVMKRSPAGNFVLVDQRLYGDSRRVEITESEAFQYLMQNGKQREARRFFPEQYEAWNRAPPR
jgi:hypothetical protein